MYVYGIVMFNNESINDSVTYMYTLNVLLDRHYVMFFIYRKLTKYINSVSTK